MNDEGNKKNKLTYRFFDKNLTGFFWCACFNNHIDGFLRRNELPHTITKKEKRTKRRGMRTREMLGLTEELESNLARIIKESSLVTMCSVISGSDVTPTLAALPSPNDRDTKTEKKEEREE
jgi:hypothetical protein